MAGVAWYALQMLVFVFLANALVYITFHDIAPSNPSYPGSLAGKSQYVHEKLFDLGFYVMPDWSHRPWIIKFAFVDLTVYMAQMGAPVVLLMGGFTKRFVCYITIAGIMNICKGLIQLVTILPPANGGEECWSSNCSEDQLATIRDQPFYTWFFQMWTTVHGCNDMVWSGHTANSTIGFLFLNVSLRNMGISWWWRSLLIVYGICYVCAVSALRMHYTVDVIVAFIVAAALFTHHPYRCWIWRNVNKIVGNVPDKPPAVSEGLKGTGRGVDSQGLLANRMIGA